MMAWLNRLSLEAATKALSKLQHLQPSELSPEELYQHALNVIATNPVSLHPDGGLIIARFDDESNEEMMSRVWEKTSLHSPSAWAAYVTKSHLFVQSERSWGRRGGHAMLLSIIERAKHMRTHGWENKTFFTFALMRHAHIVQEIFERAWVLVGRWMAVLRAECANAASSDKRLERILLEKFDRQQIFLVEIWRSHFAPDGDDELGHTYFLEQYSSADDPIGVACQVRANTPLEKTHFASEETLFALLMHEFAHILDYGAASRDDFHDRTFRDAMARNVGRAIDAAIYPDDQHYRVNAVAKLEQTISRGYMYGYGQGSVLSVDELRRKWGYARGTKRARPEPSSDDETLLSEYLHLPRVLTRDEAAAVKGHLGPESLAHFHWLAEDARVTDSDE
jgi:hypothetical protein